jgi:hypothetical protein
MNKAQHAGHVHLEHLRHHLSTAAWQFAPMTVLLRRLRLLLLLVVAATLHGGQ